jgi:predicted metal-binding membrane protein
MLMALLFVGGLMKPAWIAGIALLVHVEKTEPAHRSRARRLGAAALAMAV